MKRTDKVRFQCSKCGTVKKQSIPLKLAGKIYRRKCNTCGFVETFQIPTYQPRTKKGHHADN